MKFRDIHTHNLQAPPGSLISLPLEVLLQGPQAFAWRQGVAYSVGLHPWFVPEGWPAVVDALSDWLRWPQVVALGECGLDRLCATPYDRQLLAFRAQLALARRQAVPLVLHCVRAWDDVLPLLHREGPLPSDVVFHGFRGKPQQARQLFSKGYGLSFGPRFNAASLCLCPPARRYAETDDSAFSIAQVEALHRQALGEAFGACPPQNDFR